MLRAANTRQVRKGIRTLRLVDAIGAPANRSGNLLHGLIGGTNSSVVPSAHSKNNTIGTWTMN